MSGRAKNEREIMRLDGIHVIVSDSVPGDEAILVAGEIVVSARAMRLLERHLADPRDRWRHEPERVRLARALALLRRELRLTVVIARGIRHSLAAAARRWWRR